MLALGILLLVAALIWAAQALLLLRCGKRISLRIDSNLLPHREQKLLRVATNVAFAAGLIVYPVLRGRSPVHYYLAFFPGGRYLLELPQGFALSVIYLGLLYLAWLASDNIQIRTIARPGKAMRRLATLPASALAGAWVEELLFRGVLLTSLLETLPVWPAIALGAFAFAAAHYVRRVKRYWTFPGHLALGLMLCIAFACTRTLWLPWGLHAGGIFALLGVRPFVRYSGPAWLVGASIFPYAGVPGLIGLGLLTTNVYLLYGGLWGG